MKVVGQNGERVVVVVPVASFDTAQIIDGRFYTDGDPSGHRFVLRGSEVLVHAVVDDELSEEPIFKCLVDRDYDLDDPDDLNEFLKDITEKSGGILRLT